MLTGAALIIAGLASLAVRDAVLGNRLLTADADLLVVDADLLEYGAARGATLFRRHCEECHRAGGGGDRRAGVPNLTDGDWLYGEGRLSEIEDLIGHGIRAHTAKTWNLADMPAYARPRPYPRDPQILPLGPADISDVTEYLMALGARAHDPEAAARGRVIYAGRGACYDCHSADGRGDGAIGAPNLTDGVWLYGDGGRDSLIDTLESGRSGSCPAWSRRLGARSVRELAAYVYTLSHRRVR